MDKTKGIVRAVCLSDRRGVQKRDVGSAAFTCEWGMEGDAHGGNWHRQVSLLSLDKVRDFNERGADVGHGDFGENLVVEGLDFKGFRVGTRFRCGDVLLEMTQIGKECHSHCQIYQKMGDCIMPREGVFARVLRPGVISAGDEMQVIPADTDQYTAAVVTLSDRCTRGEREDKSGPVIADMLTEAGYAVAERLLLPDDMEKIREELVNLADRRQISLIIRTGGTGFSRRDVTPEATMAVAERGAPGIAEAIRSYSLQITGRAMLGRGVSVIRGGTLIINLPGSPKAVKESLEYILPNMKHGLDMLSSDGADCANDVSYNPATASKHRPLPCVPDIL